MNEDVMKIITDEDREYTKEDADKVMGAFEEMLRNNPATIGCPVKILNLDNYESSYAIAGMYLMTLSDPQKSVIDKVSDKKGLKGSSYLWFDKRHIAECTQAIYAAGDLLVHDGLITVGARFKIIQEIIDAAVPRQYRDFDASLKRTLQSYGILDKRESNDALVRQEANNFYAIVMGIWFIPYGQIDQITKAFIQVYEINQNSKENDEDE